MSEVTGAGDDVLSAVQAWHDAGRQEGSMLGVSEDGEMAGSASGGCIDGAVVTEAMDIMAGEPPKLLTFGVSNEEAWEVGLACGGTVEVWVEAVA